MTNDAVQKIKFLYSYGGKIVPRPVDGNLRYAGGHTRVLAVDRSITYSDLKVKFEESCGSFSDLTFKLPSEDLDVLVTVKSDDELRTVIGEYEKVSPEAKIIAVLFPIKSAKKATPLPSSPMSCFDFPLAAKPGVMHRPSAAVHHTAPRYLPAHRWSYPVVGYPVVAGKNRCGEARSPMRFHHRS